MYNVKSKDSNEFINHDEVLFSIEEAKKKSNDKNYILTLVEKARQYKGLTHREAAVLLEVDDDEILEMMYKAAKQVKEKIYGKRIVIFAP
ncbi:MAG TPA: [FeFe] hydrogenase H-cluster radical SAM maturase HydG, partial [Clostridia bacterium]|nr:[FeFe] hydrogenase H-cluster radical SAM maturase HydG [Clostridia bacterium]